VPADFRAVCLLLVNVIMGAPLFHPLADEFDANCACFREQVSTEQCILAYAYAIGVRPGELLRQWSGRQSEDRHHIQERSAARPPRKSPPPDVDDGDVGDEEEQQVCPQCGGKGYDKTGPTCSQCGGTGRVPADDDDNDDDDEIGSLKYEFEIEDE
jgi:hypothetical protein